jgi:outer membrane protein assembly factor BamE (lipoprotein component of BamABCDE complex)
MNTCGFLSRLQAWIGAALVCALCGCASYSGSALRPGVSTKTDARTLMGEPAAVHPAPPGAAFAESWEYPHGPLGRHTYMARFDSQGRLVAIDQVLTVQTVAKIRIGQDTRNEVRHLLGRPGMVYPNRFGGEIWDYAAISADGNPRKIRLAVTFDPRGLATAAGESQDMEEFSPNAGGGSSM